MTGADVTGADLTGADLPMPAPRAAGPGPAGLAECHADVCITCSDTAVAVRILELLDDDLAMVDTGSGTTEEVSVALVSAAVGDTVLVHAQEAIAVIQP
jgi:hydrogenase expression/formation protein HypC